MSMFDNSQGHELTLPMDFDSAYALANRTAAVCGNVVDDNKTLGLIRYKTKMKLSSMRNPSVITINVSRQGDGTLLRINVDSNDGVGIFRSSSRAYDEFMDALSQQSQQ